MYSNNDFRSYSENHLQHANKYGPIINGKNSSEYNHNYYLANLWRWGVKGAEAVKDAGQKLLDKTDLDERAAEAIKNTKTSIKNKIKSTNTQLDDKALDFYRNSKRRVNNALKNTGAKEASDYARAQAAYEKNRNASTANELNRARKAYANTAMGKADKAVSNVGPTYNQAARATAQARKAGNTVRTTAGNAVSAVKNAPGNAVKATKGAIKDVIKRTNTQADDQLLEAYRYARSGNKEGVKNSLKNAGGVAKNNLKNQAGVVKNTVDNYTGLAKTRLKGAIKRSDNKVDDALLEGYRAVRDGVKTGAKNTRNAIGTAAGAVANKARDIAGYDERDRRDAAARNASERPNSVTNNAYSRAQKDYDRTLLGVSEKVSNAAKDLRDRASRSAATAMDRVVDGIKDIAGYDERDRRDAAARNASERPNSATSNAYSRAQSDYNKTPLGVAENAYKAARRAYGKAVDMYGEGSQGARKAAETLAGAAQEVYKAGRNTVSTLAANVPSRIREPLMEMTNDRYDEKHYTDGAQRRDSNSKPNYPNAGPVGSNASQNERRQEQYNSRSTNSQTGRINRTATTNTNTARDNGTLTPHQKNRQDNSIPQWLENYAESVGGNAKRASKEIQKYLKEVQKHGADSRQAQEARADAMSAVTSALEPNRNVSDSGTRSSYNDTNKQQRARNTQQKEQIATNTAKPSTSSNNSNDKEFYDNWYYDRNLGIYRLDNSEHRAQVAEENAKKERMRNEFINDTQNVVDNLGRTNVERLLDAITDVGKATKKKKR